MKTLRGVPPLVLLLSLAVPATAQQQPDPDSPRYKGLVALAEFIGSDGDAAVETFLEARVAAALREAVGDDAVRDFLRALRDELDGADMRGGRPIGPLAAEIVFTLPDGGDASVEFELSEADPDRFVYIASPNNSLES